MKTAFLRRQVFFVNTLAYDWPLLAKKKFANSCRMFEATRIAVT